MAKPPTRKIVCHLGKMKSHQLTGMQIHHQREKPSLSNPDIDKSKVGQNYDLHNEKPIQFLQEAKRKIEVNAPKARIRKDSVFVVEAEISAGRKFFEDATKQEQKRFFKEAYNFLANRYGRKNVLYAVVHQDERTPHMHFGFSPITKDGRLNAKDAIMNKQEMGRIHQVLFKHLKKKGLEVEKGEPAREKHIQPQRWKFEQEKKKLLEVGRHLEKSKKLLDGRINVLKSIQQRHQYIDNIPVKESGFLMKKDRVEINKKDWEYVKSEAKRSHEYKHEMDRIKGDMAFLKDRNQMLEKDRVKARKFELISNAVGPEKLEKVFPQLEMKKERTREQEKGFTLNDDF